MKEASQRKRRHLWGTLETKDKHKEIYSGGGQGTLYASVNTETTVRLCVDGCVITQFLFLQQSLHKQELGTAIAIGLQHLYSSHIIPHSLDTKLKIYYKRYHYTAIS